MPEPTAAAAPAAAPIAHTVTISGQPRTLERMSALKMSRALAIVRAANNAVPSVIHKLGEFRTEYERTHTIELDRAQALMRYGPRAVYDGEGNPALDENGQVRMAPGALAHMTDADWAASGNVLRIPSSPSLSESIAAVFPTVLESAEEHVYQLLALFLMPNGELKRVWRSGEHVEVLDEATADLLADSYADELLELAVVCGELVDEQFTRKVRDLGDRLGKALRLFGISPSILTADQATTPTTTDEAPSSSATSSETPASSPPASSTDSPTPTAGPGTPPSTPPPTSSSSSDDALTETASRSSAPSSSASDTTPTTPVPA